LTFLKVIAMVAAGLAMLLALAVVHVAIERGFSADPPDPSTGRIAQNETDLNILHVSTDGHARR